MKFVELKLIDPILKALEDKQYSRPTPIQEQAIPIILEENDVLGCAQTGTGKTAAFSIPIIQILHKRRNGQIGNEHKLEALIVTPTRELAIQIEENIRLYSKYTNLNHTVIFGGVKQGSQVKAIEKGIDILVATPGRLLDLIGQGYISLDDVNMFVLDEADRMLDMGFIQDIRSIIRLLPTERQSLFFSATMPEKIVYLSKQILKDPKKVEVAPVSSTAETIEQYVYYTNKSSKRDLLLYILSNDKFDKVLVFSKTKHGANKISKALEKRGISAEAIHGDRSQNQRQRALERFKSGEARVLVATDIAARGIDIDKLRFVINYDVPNIPETYVHRIGRSGRAGEDGLAISFSEPEENEFILEIQKLTNTEINVIRDNPYPQTDKPMTFKEKKEFEKEKNKKRKEFLDSLRRKRHGGGKSGSKPKRKPSADGRKTSSPKANARPKRGNSKPAGSDGGNFKPKRRTK
ncbi:DEAD/DEAH box helicase [Sediminitomix flava]|uniref:DEAD-box ATP-dependent RNA helicase RhpA n=1 Tax=Sediminitomix flava TaxID=379075 RepID=A0A315ZH46_SEDFL|nr:DEAD/DEAH box helicase [Sediminitomix flava]PWJ44831.1 ATP-dependent RNA helicase RhlE [Sediminitomix flava]